MKFFENKKIWKKIVIILLIIMLFQFALTTPVVKAEDNDEGVGGILLGPIMKLIVAIGDRNP